MAYVRDKGGCALTLGGLTLLGGHACHWGAGGPMLGMASETMFPGFKE